jgi:hypothetical protein
MEEPAMPASTVNIILNGVPVSAPVRDAAEPVLYVLRN